MIMESSVVPQHKSSTQTWGMLRRIVNGVQKDFVLDHRIKNDLRDTYIIGRSRSCDITVEDKRVSSAHCKIYCDYSEVRLRVFVEDSSANGTFVNNSLTRITKGNRLELKSADEIFLINPRNMQTPADRIAAFTFINMRERLVANREIESAVAVTQSNADKTANNSKIVSRSTTNSSGGQFPHIEDHYIIGEQLGSGMSGQVYFCMHRTTGLQCAVKIIDTRKFNLNNPIKGLSVTDLMEEATIIQQLDHPSIIKVLDTFRTDQAIHIVMELLKGGDLFDRIVEKGSYSEANARKVMVKILSAVSYLHRNSIIHRDLKPENILLVSSSDDTEIKLTDFGLAKKADHDGLKTFCGTPQYFAPEVLRRKGTINGEGRYGMAADMWSLGVVLYILLTGTFPFDEDHLFDQIKTASYSLDGMEWKHISDAAKDLVQRLLKLNVKQRISVEDAMRHPWIQNITVNDGAFKANNRTQQYKPFQKSTTMGMKSNQWMDGPPANTTNTTDTASTTGDIDGVASSVAVQRSNSKPPIGTVALFLANKKPSMHKKNTQQLPVPSESNANNQQQQQQQQQQLSYEPLAMVKIKTAVPEPDARAAVEEGVKESVEAAVQPSTSNHTDDDEIEDYSSSSGGEDNEGAKKAVMDSNSGEKRKQRSDKNGSEKKKRFDESAEAKPETVGATAAAGTASGGAVVKRQRTLADAWSRLATTVPATKSEE